MVDGSNPKVSVIVPNYNHARFLPKRIESILEQSFQDFELILLDDHSSDDSRTILSRYADDPTIKIEFNERNSGSPFKQWNKGVRLARGDYVWIAESDDYADEQLLEKLVSRLDFDPTTAFSYCRSWQVSANGEISGFLESKLAGLDAQRWTTDFWADGREECQNYLVLQNTVANASAVLFRREMYERVNGADENLLICGDWKLWAAMALRGRIGYLAEPLNYCRIHESSVWATSQRLGVYTAEFLDVMRWICQKVRPPASARRKLCQHWMYVLSNEPEAALRMIEEALELFGAESFDRAGLANAWLKAAGIHYRQGRRKKAMSSVGRAIMIRPVVAGRPIKKALSRVAAVLKG